MLAHPQCQGALDSVGLVDALSLCKATAQTAFKGIRELPPGHRLQLLAGRAPSVRRYWAVERHEHADTEAQTVEKTRAMLERSLGEQLYADVPVCSLLSRCLDSTVPTAMAEK